MSPFFLLILPHQHLLTMLYVGMLSRREGRKCSSVLKSCHQDYDTGEDFSLSPPYYFPEQTAVSPIFHAYGPECLALPYLNVNKTGISWPQFSLEDKKGVKALSKIWCVWCWLAHVSQRSFSCFLLPSRWRQWQTSGATEQCSLSPMDHRYNGGPPWDYNGAETFLSPNDIMAVVTS